MGVAAMVMLWRVPGMAAPRFAGSAAAQSREKAPAGDHRADVPGRRDGAEPATCDVRRSARPVASRGVSSAINWLCPPVRVSHSAVGGRAA